MAVRRALSRRNTTVEIHLRVEVEMKRIATVLLGILMSSNAMAQSWLCKPDDSTGFKNMGGRWKHTLFDVSKRRIIIRTAKNPDDGEWLARARPDGEASVEGPFVWSGFGDSIPNGWCYYMDDKETVLCPSTGGEDEVIFRIPTLRFEAFSIGGYVLGESDILKNWSVAITIGRCSAIG
jgi:hypothetical protein